MMERARATYEFDDEQAEDESCQIVGDLVLLPEGKYEAAFDYWETLTLFGGRAQKLALWFKVLDPGYMGQRLARYYNVTRIVGKPRKRGRFKVGRKSDFLRDYCDLHGAPTRHDRVSVSKFADKAYEITVRTVTKSSNQRDIPDPLRYSVIAEIRKEGK